MQVAVCKPQSTCVGKWHARLHAPEQEYGGKVRASEHVGHTVLWAEGFKAIRAAEGFITFAHTAQLASAMSRAISWTRYLSDV